MDYDKIFSSLTEKFKSASAGDIKEAVERVNSAELKELYGEDTINISARVAEVLEQNCPMAGQHGIAFGLMFLSGVSLWAPKIEQTFSPEFVRLRDEWLMLKNQPFDALGQVSIELKQVMKAADIALMEFCLTTLSRDGRDLGHYLDEIDKRTDLIKDGSNAALDSLFDERRTQFEALIERQAKKLNPPKRPRWGSSR